MSHQPTTMNSPGLNEKKIYFIPEIQLACHPYQKAKPVNGSTHFVQEKMFNVHLKHCLAPCVQCVLVGKMSCQCCWSLKKVDR